MVVLYDDVINEINRVYHESLSREELEKGADRLRALIKEGKAAPSSLDNAKALFYRINAKLLSIAYFDGGYLEEDHITLSDFLREAVKALRHTDYTNTVLLLDTLTRITEEIHGVMADAEALRASVLDDSGEIIAPLEELERVWQSFCEKVERVDAFDEIAFPFGTRVKMFDIQKQAKKDLSDVRDSIADRIFELRREKAEAFLIANVTPLEAEEGVRYFDHHPSVSSNGSAGAGTLLLSSPFRDEVLLFARAYADAYGRSFLCLSMSAFAAASPKYIRTVFEALEGKGADLLILDAAAYRDENKTLLYECLLRHSRSGLSVLISDTGGDRRIYQEMYRLAQENEAFSVMDVSTRYLTLPGFDEVTSAFERRGMITAEDHAFLRAHMAFMGYVGFNRGVELFAAGKPWRDAVMDISERHEAQAAAYLRNIPSQEQLLDPVWRDLRLVRDQAPRRGFDYDAVKLVNPANIEKILRQEISLYAKCGMIARYCTLCGDDISVWATLSREEREERISEAVRLVASLLETQYSPTVRLLTEKEWEKKSAGALCCDGGKEILFREKTCMDHSYTVRSICHECYHAFQATLTGYSGWKAWHRSELGVTRHRVHEWRYNEEHYVDSEQEEIYRVEILEGDARIFEEDCFAESALCYHTVFLE